MRLRWNLAHRPSLILLFLFLSLAIISTSYSQTLTYQGSNKWVAQADIQPLRTLLNQAKNGQTHFLVVLPPDNRPLSTARLEVLLGLMEKAAGKGIVLEEADGTTPANTLHVQSK